MTATDHLPHEGGCEHCRAEGTCSVCAAPIAKSQRCTNGRCLDCHRQVCTGGGTPQHGYGTRDAAVEHLARARAKAARR